MQQKTIRNGHFKKSRKASCNTNLNILLSQYTKRNALIETIRKFIQKQHYLLPQWIRFIALFNWRNYPTPLQRLQIQRLNPYIWKHREMTETQTHGQTMKTFSMMSNVMWITNLSIIQRILLQLSEDDFYVLLGVSNQLSLCLLSQYNIFGFLFRTYE